MSRKIARPKRTPEIGREKKIMKFPFDKIRDCRREVSIIGPRMNANKRGAASNLTFFIRCPRTPKMTMIKISIGLLLIP